MTHITEIIPKDMPDWFKQDMEDGQVFARMVKRYNAQDKLIKLLTDCETCPCSDVGYFVVCGVDGEPEQEQCQFCYETENSRFNALLKVLQGASQ